MKKEEKRYCLRTADLPLLGGRKAPQYLEAVAYGGPGNPVPYWTTDIREAKLWKTPRMAFEAQAKYGGVVRLLRVDENGKPEQEYGTVMRHSPEDDDDIPVRKKGRWKG